MTAKAQCKHNPGARSGTKSQGPDRSDLVTSPVSVLVPTTKSIGRFGIPKCSLFEATDA